MSLTTEQLKGLTLGRYEFRLRACEDVSLPTFPGSTRRGSFGHALKAIACSVEHQDRYRCLLAEACLYPNIFEPSALPINGTEKKQADPPRLFLFQPPLPRVAEAISTIENNKRAWSEKHIPLKAGESFSFGMTLFGTAISKLPYIVYAVELMARHGLGFARVPFGLEEVLIVNERNESLCIYTPQMTRITPHKTKLKTLCDLVEHRLAQMSFNDSLTLLFITPTWVEIRKYVLESVTFGQLVTRLSWRMAQVFELYGEAPLLYDYKTLIEQSATVETINENLWFHQFERFANRTQSKKPLRGFLGAITYRGETIKELLSLIIAGEFLQLGRETAFGLGRYWTLA